MKTLRYLLMVMTVALVSITAQAQFKTSQNKVAFDNSVAKAQHEFYSTSTLMESGSRLPLAARNGLTIGANTPDDNASGGVSARGPRRAKMDDFDDDDISGIDKPEEPGTPVGEGMWALLLMAAGFAFGKWRYQMMLRRRKETA